ncbi:MAG: hypothetical protein M3R38_11065 [Actinomycetota bacterium]|nr:hypothetical protein [Actinomycetota bacterium]
MEENRERALQWFEDRGVDLNCTQCGGENFRQGGVVALFAAAPEDFAQTHHLAAYPVICTNCGHFILFHAGTMGLEPESSDDRP